jgi:hypothetical protein
VHLYPCDYNCQDDPLLPRPRLMQVFAGVPLCPVHGAVYESDKRSLSLAVVETIWSLLLGYAYPGGPSLLLRG